MKVKYHDTVKMATAQDENKKYERETEQVNQKESGQISSDCAAVNYPVTLSLTVDLNFHFMVQGLDKMTQLFHIYKNTLCWRSDLLIRKII
jgi:hypothetical protein